MSLSPFSKLLLTPTNIRAKVNLCKPNERGTRSTISIYHLVWCPKYRRPLLTDAVAQRLDELVRQQVKVT